MEKGDAKRGEEVFSIFRDYVKHEDMLINQRMTWMITIQSFLIATFAFSYQKKFEVIVKFLTETDPRKIEILNIRFNKFMETIHTYNGFLVIICMIGISMSITTYSLLDAANKSIKGLESKWIKTSELYEVDHLPKLTGGHDYNEAAKLSGEKLSRNLTFFFVGFWGFLILFILMEACKNFQIKSL